MSPRRPAAPVPPPVEDAAAAWLLTADERGNPATAIDLERGDGQAWTASNQVTVHVDGAAYFRRLYELLSGLEAGDWVYHWPDGTSDPTSRDGTWRDAVDGRGSTSNP